MNASNPKRKITVPEIFSRKSSKDNKFKPISAITAYDFTFARLIDETEIDIILIGDSLASVIQGQPNTLPVTLEEMIYHAKCVCKAVGRALTVADMPFLSYQISKERALEGAGRLLKETGVASVKLEGGINIADTIEHLVKFDIPVMGHVGLTPQSYHRMGGHRVQGRLHDSENQSAGSYERLIEDALAVEKAGAFALVVECVPVDLAREITDKVSIPTIGIGAGSSCDGQILVMHDLLGLEDRKKPKFVKNYANMASLVKDSISQYVQEVQSHTYPSAEHSFEPELTEKNKKQKLQLV